MEWTDKKYFLARIFLSYFPSFRRKKFTFRGEGGLRQRHFFRVYIARRGERRAARSNTTECWNSHIHSRRKESFEKLLMCTMQVAIETQWIKYTVNYSSRVRDSSMMTSTLSAKVSEREREMTALGGDAGDVSSRATCDVLCLRIRMTFDIKSPGKLSESCFSKFLESHSVRTFTTWCDNNLTPRLRSSTCIRMNKQ